MKILFLNPPVIRSASSSPENDFKIDGLVSSPIQRKIPGFSRLLRSVGAGKGIRYGVRAGSRWPWTMETPVGALHYPFIMAYAAANLRSQGFDVELIDAVADEEYSYSSCLDQVKSTGADIVIIECSTPTIDIDLWFAEKVAKFTTVCLAGPHLTSQAETIQSEHPAITYLLKGEYIISALEMARTRHPGIYESVVVDDMDALPLPFRDYPAAIRYFDPTMPTPRPQLQIYASKGCPFKCSFCLWPQTMYQHKVSYRKPEKIAEEIRLCVSKYGYKSIFFDDDTFNIGNKRISQICDELKAIGLPWTMMGRLDCSPPWLYDKMVDSGCVGMRFGIETFDTQVLKNIKKGLESEELIETLRYICTKYPQVMLHVTMMKDLPGQTESIHAHDMKVLEEFGFSPHDKYRNYQLAACAPFPGTEMYETMRKEGHFMDDFSRYDGGADTIMTQEKNRSKL
jgi:anaerobic magnesium-protoporphyrin IX monomethyl ester cyclase